MYKMYIGHLWDIIKLTFPVRSDEGLILERLYYNPFNGGQFTSLVQLIKNQTNQLNGDSEFSVVTARFSLKK